MKGTLYTDGSSRGNPGPGGWGVIYFDDEVAHARPVVGQLKKGPLNTGARPAGPNLSVGAGGDKQGNDFFIRDIRE